MRSALSMPTWFLHYRTDPFVESEVGVQQDVVRKGGADGFELLAGGEPEIAEGDEAALAAIARVIEADLEWQPGQLLAYDR